MKKITLSYLIVLFSVMFLLSGCEVIGDIFKAGVWVGILLVVAVVVLILKLTSGNKNP